MNEPCGSQASVMRIVLRRIGNLCGIVAPILWASAIVVCGSLRPGYSHLTQYISELGERGSSTELLMRYGGFLPTGLMHVAFAAFLGVAFKGSRPAAFAAVLLAINGLARVCAGMFPCETGCAGAGMISQRLHNLSATIGFFALIGAALIWGVVFRRYQSLRALSAYSIGSAILGLVFLVLMSRSEQTRAGTGLYESLASGVLSLWILVFAVALWWRGTHREILPKLPC